MPKFIGAKILNVKQIEDNAANQPQYVRLSYNQAVILNPEDLLCSLNTLDKGGKQVFAKRWYNWFGKIESIRRNPKSTKKMLAKTGLGHS